jgi:radical SAM protein with 4Fe4S-binding SPASM domain
MFDEFCAIQGLRVLVSGGEPTMYRHFDYVNEIIDEYPLRFVLLTNGISLTHQIAKRLKFHEVQISLDGMKQGHEAIRGPGTFKKVLTAMDRVREAGIDLSVASMVHRQNLSEWDDMLKLLENLGVKEWNIDYPCHKGRWELHPDLFVDLKIAGQKMTYGFGGSYHGSDPGWTCGRHLAAILPSGAVCRCALFQDHVLGTVAQGIKKAWQRVHHIPLQATECRDCVHADDCGGGCRYRAGGSHQRDEIMCAVHSFCS